MLIIRRIPKDPVLEQVGNPFMYSSWLSWKVKDNDIHYSSFTTSRGIASSAFKSRTISPLFNPFIFRVLYICLHLYEILVVQSHLIGGLSVSKPGGSLSSASSSPFAGMVNIGVMGQLVKGARSLGKNKGQDIRAWSILRWSDLSETPDDQLQSTPV